MGKIKKLIKTETSPINTGDEDYQYEQYLKEKKSIFPDGMEYDDEYYKSTYIPTPKEEDENFKQTLKQNGHTS